KSDVMQKITFSEPLTEVPPATALKLYALSEHEVNKVILLTGSGATTDEFSLWQAKSEQSAAIIEKKIRARLDTLIADCKNYNPSEVPKLERAIVLLNGKYVTLCVTGDLDNATKVISPNFK
ncbi:MAG: DUF4358 domain-containing protein, partial [Clostridia bacterium]